MLCGSCGFAQRGCRSPCRRPPVASATESFCIAWPRCIISTRCGSTAFPSPLPRALLDLAPRLAPTELTRAAHEAWIRHGTSPADVERCIARNPGKNGARKLLRALGSDVTLSDLEEGFLALMARHGLPLPRTNIDHAGDKVDCHWPQLGLTLELLSFRFHGTRKAFEDDVARRRHSSHIAYTWGDVFERGDRTAAELTPLLRH